jgi:hypothetical protein
MNVRDYVIFELFRPEPSELVSSFKVQRRISTLETLIDNRNDWSPTLSTFTVVYQEMADVLLGINRELAKTYTQYGNQNSDQNPMFLQQEYRPYAFINFLQSGKQFFRDTIDATEKEIDAIIGQKKSPMRSETFGAWFDRQLSNRPRGYRFDWIAPKELRFEVEYSKIKKELITEEYPLHRDRPVELTENLWKRFKQSRSLALDSYDDLDRLDPDDQKYQRIGYTAIETGKFETPVIVKEHTAYNVVSGEATLQLCRVAGITPRVIIVEICCEN